MAPLKIICSLLYSFSCLFLSDLLFNHNFHQFLFFSTLSQPSLMQITLFPLLLPIAITGFFNKDRRLCFSCGPVCARVCYCSLVLLEGWGRCATQKRRPDGLTNQHAHYQAKHKTPHQFIYLIYLLQGCCQSCSFTPVWLATGVLFSEFFVWTLFAIQRMNFTQYMFVHKTKCSCKFSIIYSYTYN